ncbi:MAG: hypothetical protein ACJ789_02740 [Thermomicrobiales bacterium]
MITPLASDVWAGWGSVLFVSLIAILIGAVVIIGAWQSIKSANVKSIARETVARDEAYRKLAEETASSNQRLARDQQQMAETLFAVQTKVDAIERMLREVE